MKRVLSVFFVVLALFSHSLYALTKEDFITEIYEKILDRTPSDGEISYWISKLNEGKSAAFVLRYFFRSEEFENRHYSDEEFVTKLYRVVLERDPDEEGFEYWLREIEEENIFRDYIFYKFIFSEEFEKKIKNLYKITPFTKEDKLRAFIERFYNILFNRRADERGVNYWEEELKKGNKTIAQIANSFFFSEEFEKKNYSDEKFVRLSYLTLLNRNPDKGGAQFWTSFLKNGGSKKELIKSFLSSEEFKNLTEEYGIFYQNGKMPDFAKPVGEIKSVPEDFGGWGDHTIGKKTFTGSYGKDITLFYPADAKQKTPVIFFIPGWYDNSSQSYKKYDVLLNFVASKGFAIVFIPYTQSYKLYKEVKKGIEEAAEKFKDIIDLSKVGLTGFSSGGGVTISIGYDLFKNKKWGEKGRFLLLLSPWYDFGMEEYEDKGEYLLSHYPKNTQMIIQRYDKDEDDPRTVIDFYKNISIPNDDKDFIIVHSSPGYPAVHTIPYSPKYGADALDYFVIFRFIDALGNYSFYKNEKAKNVALGNGSEQQIELTKGLKDLTVTDEPEKVLKIEEDYKYTYPCNSKINPRADFCYEFVL